MKIFILSSGEYGKKIVNGIATYGLAGDIVGIHEYSSKEDLPEFIDDVSEYIPENIPEADLIIAVGIHGDVNMVIPEVVAKSGAKSVIVSIYHPQQIPLGLQNEIKNSLDEEIAIEFPKPFCALLPTGDKYIDEFTKIFGKPKLKINVDNTNNNNNSNNINNGTNGNNTNDADFDETKGVIDSVEVIRGTPCGSTWFIAENLIGVQTKDAEFEANNKLHNFPCLASMATDNITGDTVLHLASYKTKEAIKRALGFTCKSALVDEEVCEGLEECENICLKSCPNVLTGDNTIYLAEHGKAQIDPASCGVCEICIKECPYGAIEVYEEKIPIKKVDE